MSTQISCLKGAVHNVRRLSPAIPESPWRSQVASIIRLEAESEAQMSEAHESRSGSARGLSALIRDLEPQLLLHDRPLRGAQIERSKDRWGSKVPVRRRREQSLA